MQQAHFGGFLLVQKHLARGHNDTVHALVELTHCVAPADGRKCYTYMINMLVHDDTTIGKNVPESFLL